MKCPLNANVHIKKSLSIGFVTLLLLRFVMVMSLPIGAEHPAQAIWVEPASTFLQTCENFTVDVKINITVPTLPGGGTGLFGFQYMLKWNSTILEATSIEFHSPWPMPPAFLVKNETGVTPDGYDYHLLAISALFPQTPFTGVTSLCTYTFHVKTLGSSSLDIRLGPTDLIECLLPPELLDDTGTPITITVVDGYFSDPYPRALFTYSPEFPAVNETVTFNASESYDPDGTIVSYAWNFGDGTTDTGMIVTHNYTASLPYNVTLTVTDNASLTDTTWHIVKVGTVAIFTYSPEFPLTGEIVTFNATESSAAYPPIVNYTWNFGDGTPVVTEPDPIINHTYTAAGPYNVTLTVTDNASLTDTTWHIVKVGRWPVAIFTYSPDFPLVNETVRFDATESDDPDGIIVSYAWDFGDGTPVVTEPDPITTHNYTTFGTYNVTLTVTDNETLTDSTSALITVWAKPLASFTWSPETPEIGETVTFDASASNDPDGDIVDYEWDFGDGTEDSGIDPTMTKTYSAASIYTVKLTVTDDDRLTGTATRSITIVKASSTISISASPETIEVGENTTISGSITPTRADVTVTIYYRLTGETWETLENVTTNSDGGYSYVWTPDEAGTYEVKASWLGDDKTLGDESSVTAVTVEEAAAPPPDYLLYGAIVIVVVIVAAIAIYFLKKRKS